MENIKAAITGFIIGDAMGVPIEFKLRQELMKNPTTEMIGYGSHFVPAGVWSDDTSMTLATIDSICAKNGIDYADMMNRFLNWYQRADYTATGCVFDIGRTTVSALAHYAQKKGDPTQCGCKGAMDNGNGSLMRMLPIAIYSYYQKLDEKKTYSLVENASSLTHAHEISILGCYLYVQFLHRLFAGEDQFTALNQLRQLDLSRFCESSLHAYRRILKGRIENEPLDTIHSSGYVVDTLEAALWVTLNTTSFRQAIITAINLGEDTDTIGAITGSLAGTLYGEQSLPQNWLDSLKNKATADRLIDR